jgi:hypothetical protein
MEKREVASGAEPRIFDASLFDGSLNGWEFKSWMPEGRQIRHELKCGVGYLGGPGLEIYADGCGDDGIFFLQKRFPVNGLSGSAFLSWSFARKPTRLHLA